MGAEESAFERNIDRDLRVQIIVNPHPGRSLVMFTFLPLTKQIDAKWHKAGLVNVDVLGKKAIWGYIRIHESSRGKGIGSKTVKFIIAFLKSKGVKEVWGEIRDDNQQEKVIKFWKKNGFSVEVYPQPKGDFVAKINFSI